MKTSDTSESLRVKDDCREAPMVRQKEPVKKDTARRALKELERLACNNGLDNVSMRSVAKAMGISLAALQYHYPNKATMIAAFVSASVEEHEARIKAIAHDDAHGEHLPEVLAYILDIALTEAHNGMFAMIEARAHHDAATAEPLRSFMHAYLLILQELIAREHPGMSDSETLIAATMMAALIDGAFSKINGAVELGAHKDELIETLIRVARGVPDMIARSEAL
ncbi:MAG: TetR/AcrR family transcriptional regulator [Myxococcota bacterium]